MSNTDVTINTGGYNITQADIDAVTNPFLDLGEALDKGKFYFLEGQYDQIVLEQIFNILYGTNANVLAAVDKQKGVVNAAETAYNDMAAKVAALREIGAYDMATLITSLKNTYAVNGTIPSRNGISCTSAINVPYTDLLSIVCDLCGEAVGDINLRAPSFSGEADLSTLKSQLESYVIGQLESYATDQLESYVTDLKTSLESKLTDYLADYETQLRANIPLDDLKTALEGVVAGLDDGTKKNDINAAIAAITTYSTGTVDEETTNWDALKTALNAVKDYVEISDITPSTASVIAVIDAMDKITTYNANKTDANLNDVKTALDTIKDYAEISDNISSTANVIAVIDAMDKIATYAANKTDANWEAIKAMLEDENLSAILGITSPSIANVTAVIDAMDKIATYAANKTDANWEAIKAMLEDKNLSAILGITSPSAANITTVIDAIDKITTYAANKTDAALETVKKALEAIDGLSGISTQISIPSMIGNISTYFNVKTAIEQAKRAIDTLKGSKTKANLDDVFSKLSAVNTALEQIPTTLRTSYYDANLKAEIDAAISKTSTIRSKLGGLIDAIDAYKGASTLMESLDFFQEITIAFNAFSDGTMQADFGNSKVPDLSNRINSCATNLNNVFSTFGKFYEDLDTLITTCQNPTVKDLLDSNQQKTYYDGNSLKSNLTYAQFVALCDALSNSLNGLSNAVTTAESSLNAAQKTLGDITPANTTATICDLLNLC
ncbi:MAG: hypothetical protein LBC30_01775, partial [Puniceicoccales bacterium]|nr:hypothetical protein [Puniceicoccales bacterium]